VALSESNRGVSMVVTVLAPPTQGEPAAYEPSRATAWRGAQRVLFWVGMLTLVLTASWLFLWNLGSSSISGRSDEVVYVRMVQETLHHGHIFPLYHGRNPAFEKPPLKLWLAASVAWLLGENNLSFRLLDGVLGVVAVLLTVLLSWRLLRAPLAAVCCGFLCLMAPEWVIHEHSFRRAVLDGFLVVVTLGLGLATVSLLEAQRQGRSARAALFCLAALGSAGVLTKSVAGFVPLACCGVSVVLAGRGAHGACDMRSLLRRLRALWPLGVPVMVWCAYVAAVGLVGGRRGLETFIGVEILDRVFHGFEGHNTGQRGFYLWYALVRGGLAPAGLLALGSLGAVLAAFSRQEGWRYRTALVWGWLPLALYSFSRSRTPWYVSPCVPWMALLAVGGTLWLFERLPRDRMWLRGVVALVVVVSLVGGPYWRALQRAASVVAQPAPRLALDLVVERLRGTHTEFVIVESAISGRSNPLKGRFNVEGIYRESLRPALLPLASPEEVVPRAGVAIFVRERDLARLPPGWRLLETLAAWSDRVDRVAVVEYG
jgi:4-amino-4-deoxy-L-arabinose transferase-like glycosyltransferase